LSAAAKCAAQAALSALHLPERVVGAHSEVAVLSARPRVGGKLGERLLGFSKSALHLLRHRQVPVDKKAQIWVILVHVGAGPLRELNRTFDFAALTGELGSQHRDRPWDVRQPPGRLADRWFVRLINCGQSTLGVGEQRFDFVHAAIDERPDRPSQDQPWPGADRTGR